MEDKKYKILIVDDDRFLLDMYPVKFTQLGFDVATSLGSVDALAKLREGFVPDVILTDLLMPTMDGFELLEKIKEEKLAQGSKIIILSNKGERTDIDRGIALGADGYIIKASVIPSEVVEKVMEVLKK
ncbi:PleD family two-component system response regulator [Patescibacteria group bacterium]